MGTIFERVLFKKSYFHKKWVPKINLGEFLIFSQFVYYLNLNNRTIEIENKEFK